MLGICKENGSMAEGREMKNKKFVLMGNGYIAKVHKKVISDLGGNLINIYDPLLYGGWLDKSSVDNEEIFYRADYVVICSPTQHHRGQILQALKYLPEWGEIIVEKPMWLPSEKFIDDDRINVVLQYRWAPIHKPIKLIKVKFIRDQDYFKTWKGDARKSGGFIFNLFIHYLDLAYLNGAGFEGVVRSEGKGYRKADDIDLQGFSSEHLYRLMYESIGKGFGVKPRYIYPLWDYLCRRLKDIGDDSRVLDGMPFYYFHH